MSFFVHNEQISVSRVSELSPAGKSERVVTQKPGNVLPNLECFPVQCRVQARLIRNFGFGESTFRCSLRPHRCVNVRHCRITTGRGGGAKGAVWALAQNPVEAAQKMPGILHQNLEMSRTSVGVKKWEPCVYLENFGVVLLNNAL